MPVFTTIFTNASVTWSGNCLCTAALKFWKVHSFCKTKLTIVAALIAMMDEYKYHTPYQ